MGCDTVPHPLVKINDLRRDLFVLIPIHIDRRVTRQSLCPHANPCSLAIRYREFSSIPRFNGRAPHIALPTRGIPHHNLYIILRDNL